MLQRKQTLFLAIAIVLIGLLFLMPFATFHYASLRCEMFVLGITGMEYTAQQYLFWILQGLATATIALCLVALCFFKKRALQIRLCLYANIFNVLLIGMLFLTTSIISQKLESPAQEVKMGYELACYFPVLTLLLITMAQRAIRRDEALVRSTERLR